MDENARVSPRVDENDPSKSQATCRICLGDDPEIGNPFVSPCKCSGTMKFLHIKCLQIWLSSRLQFKQNAYAKSWYWKSFDCELCKRPFPNTIEVEGKRYDIIEITKPDGSFIMLEILSRDRNQSRGIHIIGMDSKHSIKLVSALLIIC